jgi:two-component system sensor histidine kinase BaeS
MDGIRISQALGNLIENALQHTPKGGRITIQCEFDGDNLIPSICDTGTGIPAEDLPHIFERFYRVDSARQTDTGRRGLGLAIVKQIVEAHQGEVWVESESGKGTCFYLRLPI